MSTEYIFKLTRPELRRNCRCFRKRYQVQNNSIWMAWLVLIGMNDGSVYLACAHSCYTDAFYNGVVAIH